MRSLESVDGNLISTRRERPAGGLVALAFALGSLVTSPSASPMPTREDSQLLPPALGGQWAGPYTLTFRTGYFVGEITHAAELPPHVLGGASSQFAGKVMFLTARTCGTDHPTSSWLWNPANPSAIEAAYAIPNTEASTPGAGAEDPWCGAQAFLENGDWVAWGGTVWSPGNCLNCPFGTRRIWRWSTLTGEWSYEGMMVSARWYPGTCELHDGRHIVSGSCTSGQGSLTNEVFLSTAPVVSQSSGQNLFADPSCVPLGGSADVAGGYPWFMLVKSGFVLVAGPLASPKGYVKDCPNLIPPRGWIVDNQPALPSARDHGNALILLTLEGGVRKETVYTIGGDPGAFGGNPCTLNTLASMDRVIDPAPGVPWTPNVASMTYSRSDANSMVGPDGKVYVIGGRGYDFGTGTCVARYRPEVFDPLTNAWAPPLNPQGAARGYHSIALVLLDGRMLSAGGQNSPHTVEIFSPPYLFQGAPPSILSGPPYVQYSWPNFTLYVYSENPLTKVSLLRTSSVTHGLDFNQRYVELLIEQQTQPDPGNPNLRQLVVRPPESGWIAPPGWYKLFAVASGVPSLGQFLHVRN